MIPRSLRIKNIGPFRDQSIELSDIPGGLVAVTGLNGQGKTFFLESIVASLYRELPSRANEGIYKYCTDRNAGLELEFEMAGKIYRSVINIDSKNRKMEAVLALDKLPLNDGKTGTFDEQIERILGSKDKVLASSYGAQDKKGNFTELAKAKRKDLFIQMIGMQLLQDISECTGKSGCNLEPEKTNLAGQIEILRVTAEKVLPDIDAIRAKLTAKREEYIGLQETLDDLSKHLVLEGAKYERLPTIQSDRNEKCTRIQELQAARKPLNDKLKAAEDSLALAPQAQVELDLSKKSLVTQRERLIILRQKTETIPTLNIRRKSLWSTYQKNEDECNRLRLQRREQALLSESLASLREKAEELGRVRAENEEAASTLRQVNAEIVRMSQEESERSKALLLMQNKINSAVRDETESNKSLLAAQINSKALKEVPCGGVGEYATCPLIKTAVESSGKIDELTAKVDNYKITLLSLRQEFDTLPRPDDAGKARIKIEAERLTKTVNSTCSRIKELEEIVAKLPAAEAANSQIVILNQSLSSSQEARDAAKTDHDAVDREIQDIEKMRDECATIETVIPKIEERIGQLDEIIKQSQQAETVIPTLKADLERNNTESDSLESIAGALLLQINALESAKGQYEADTKLWNATKETTMPTLQAEIDMLAAEAAAADSETSSILTAQSKLREVESSLSVITYRMACYARVSKSFGPMEIQSFEIDSAGPEVSRLSNDLLFNCFGPRFSIRFVTQELKVDGKGYKDEFDVSVDDQKTGKTHSIGDLSGGEKTIVGEALALGIALYNKEKSGVAWNTLFRDEVSGALDDVYAPQYIAMLRAAREMGHFKQVYFICHQARLKQMADSRILIADGTATLAP
jgi:DNA repair protein SbcC/Rad50